MTSVPTERVGQQANRSAAEVDVFWRERVQLVVSGVEVEIVALSRVLSYARPEDIGSVEYRALRRVLEGLQAVVEAAVAGTEGA